ncbi:MAG: hypothetical protein WAV47_22830 [Blastocatellia bacterium]
MRSSVAQLIRISSGALLFLAINGSVLAQQRTPPPAPSSPAAASRADFEKYKANKRESDARETDIRLAEKGAKEIDGNKESITLKRVSENFARLQTVTNEIMDAVKHDPTLDYLRVKGAAAEINKCAQRIKGDLVFPEAKGKREKRDDSDDTDVKATLGQLDLLVKAFVTNPFLTKGLQEEALGAKAGRDLDEIIELSNSIRKHSERLSKTSLKP